ARGAAEAEAALLEVAALEAEGARRGVEDDVALLEDAVDVFVALRGDRLAGEGLLLEAHGRSSGGLHCGDNDPINDRLTQVAIGNNLRRLRQRGAERRVNEQPN